MVMSISEIAMLTFGMVILASSVLISNQVYAPSHIDGGTFANICGDGVLDPGEQCDDGNLLDGDGCSAICEVEFGPVGVEGEYITADTTSLLLAGAQMNAVWMIPVVVSAVGIGVFILKKKF